MNKTLQILMPMAGEGMRFQKAGYNTLKPLLLFEENPFFYMAAKSFVAEFSELKFIFILREDHDLKYGLKEAIKKYLPDSEIVTLASPTSGPLETLSYSFIHLDAASPVVSLDCDLWFKCSPYFQWLKEVLVGTTSVSGGLTYFQSTEPRFSYVKVDSEGRAIETAEKVVISSNAIIGAYAFSSGKIFQEHAQETLRNFKKAGEKNREAGREPTVALVYNSLIGSGMGVRAFPVEEYKSFGTPDELTLHAE